MAADDDRAEALFEAALGRSTAGPSPVDHARTQLLYGEWLRRMRRRQRARTQLSLALATFESVGAEEWAARAREELSPSAGRTRARDAAGQLTPHEWRIAYAAAQGRTSREIAAQVLLSVRTVDYHLGNVYRKLGIRSRRELIGRLRQHTR